MKFLTDTKFANLPLAIGGCIDIEGTVRDTYDTLELVQGHTYYFSVYHNDKPLTRKGVPYKPVKLTIVDIKGVCDIFLAINNDQFTYDYHEIDNLIKFQGDLKGRFRITTRHILCSVIRNMFMYSDLIQNTVENHYVKAIETYDCVEPTIVGVTHLYILNLTLVYARCDIPELKVGQE
jgi:hypothetical protein